MKRHSTTSIFRSVTILFVVCRWQFIHFFCTRNSFHCILRLRQRKKTIYKENRSTFHVQKNVCCYAHAQESTSFNEAYLINFSSINSILLLFFFLFQVHGTSILIKGAIVFLGIVDTVLNISRKWVYLKEEKNKTAYTPTNNVIALDNTSHFFLVK